MPCPGARDTDRDGKRDSVIGERREPIERARGPCRTRRIEEGAALRRRLQMPFLRGRKGGRKLGDRAQRSIVAVRDRAIGVGEEDAIAVTAAIGDHHREP